MSILRLRRTVESETLHLPELKPLIGQTVDITVAPAPADQNAPSDWLPGFWETISKGWQGEVLVRPEQGVPEIRDQLR
jgi:hypothetical protein